MPTLTSRQLGRIHGGYYFLSGVWPMVAGTSFQQVTGFKVDFWLAQLVGALLVLQGAILVVSARTGSPPRELQYLTAGSAVLLGIFDFICVPLPNTMRIYWLDAGVELTLVISWLGVWWKAAP